MGLALKPDLEFSKGSTIGLSACVSTSMGGIKGHQQSAHCYPSRPSTIKFFYNAHKIKTIHQSFTMKFLLATITFLIPLSFALPAPQEGDTQCQTFCTLEYNPQCGRDEAENTRTFSNPCVFRKHNCENPEQVYTQVELSECNDSVC